MVLHDDSLAPLKLFSGLRTVMLMMVAWEQGPEERIGGFNLEKTSSNSRKIKILRTYDKLRKNRIDKKIRDLMKKKF